MKHGTPAGYNRHRANNEAACRECLDARLRYSRLVRARQVSRMQLPVGLIAGMYLHAPIALQVKVEEYLTVPVVDALVSRLDGKDGTA